MSNKHDINIILINISTLVSHLQTIYSEPQNYDIYDNDPYCSAFAPPFGNFYNKKIENNDIPLNNISNDSIVKEKLLDIQIRLENITKNKEYPYNITPFSLKNGTMKKM